ncbi:AAA family ATPase [Acinetobacter sp. Ac_5812]|uniref:AAA family ATPase n=1 Tax=Acinetobacter sp. Ac_5812 TaxID=1848937 RepID=UPI0014905995|nr:AAA family ATPase [Acinetobacter sp. Ac_5812]NNP67742.1 adenylate kinase [Acinetobacter sp. Ac_5812]
MKFINIIGTTGSGKSTLARQLAQKQQLQYIELDNLLWLDDWQESPNDDFFDKLKSSMDAAPAGWVIDNLYTRSIDRIWSEVDTVIWLDYSFSINLYRLTKRTLWRALSRERLWEDSNNRESWKMMFSKKSIFLWMLQKYPQNKRRYLAMMQHPDYQHIRFIHLTTPTQTRRFLESLHL